MLQSAACSVATDGKGLCYCFCSELAELIAFIAQIWRANTWALISYAGTMEAFLKGGTLKARSGKPKREAAQQKKEVPWVEK